MSHMKLAVARVTGRVQDRCLSDVTIDPFTGKPLRPRLPEPLSEQIVKIAHEVTRTNDLGRAQAAFALLKIADDVRELEGEAHARKRRWRGWLARFIR